MKFIVTKASKINYKKEIELNTLEELINFIKKEWAIVVQQEYIDRDTPKDEFSIIIYDDYDENEQLYNENEKLRKEIEYLKKDNENMGKQVKEYRDYKSRVKLFIQEITTIKNDLESSIEDVELSLKWK